MQFLRITGLIGSLLIVTGCTTNHYYVSEAASPAGAGTGSAPSQASKRSGVSVANGRRSVVVESGATNVDDDGDGADSLIRLQGKGHRGIDIGGGGIFLKR